MSTVPEAPADPPKIEFRRGIALFRRLWPFMRPEARLAALIGALQVVSIPAGVVSPLLVKHVFDVSLPAGDRADLMRTLGWIVALTLASHLLRTVAALRTVTLQNRVRHRLVRMLFAHVLRLPVRYFHKTETGYVMARIREDVQSLDGVMIDRVIDAGIDLVRAILFLVLLLAMDLGLALSGLAFFVVIASGVVAMSAALRRRSERAQELDAESSSALHQAITGIVTVRTAAREPGERARFGRANRASIRAIAGLQVLHTGVGYLIGLAMAVGIYVILGIGALRIEAEQSSIGGLFAFWIYLTYVAGAVTSLLQLNPAVQRAFASLDRIFRMVDEPEERPLALDVPAGAEHARAAPLGKIAGRVTFERVSFRYGDEIPALTDVSLDVRPGEVVALVGRSGAGKSTLVNLVPRLFDPDEGVVRIDGEDVRRLPLQPLRRQIGVVPQDVFLFNRTIRDNIAYATPGATDDAVHAAARAAHADVFVQRLPKGYDTMVGERGVKLSGGEKQRIAIAREILRDPPILILDEATSSLDSESEALIRDAIDRLKRDRTCFIIAHRLSTVLGADRIVVLDRGRIVEIGTHAELLTQNGLYRTLHDLQFQPETAAS